MSEQHEPIEEPTVGRTSKLRFEDCDYTAQETQRLLAVRPTTFYEKVLPELEHYLAGNRRKFTGRSILEYRKRKLAEAQQKSAVGSRGSKQLRKSRNKKRRSRKSGAAP